MTALVGIQFFSALLEMIHRLAYMHNGFGNPVSLAMSESACCIHLTLWVEVPMLVFDVTVQILFIFILLLLGHGWCITYMRLRWKQLTFFVVGLFAGLYLLLFSWGVLFIDPATTLYIYESVPGLLILIVRLVVAVWFAKAVFDARYTSWDLDSY